MKCPKCNAMIQDGAKFCTECGAPLAAPQEPLMPPTVQLPYAQASIQPTVPLSRAQQINLQPPVTPGEAASPSEKPEKKRGKTVLIAVIAVVALAVGALVCAKLFRSDDTPASPNPTDAPTESLSSAETTAETTASAEETTGETEEPTGETTAAPTRAAQAGDLSAIYGEWLDQGGVYNLYVARDGSFLLTLTEGLFTGNVERQGEDYLLKAFGAPAPMNNAVLTPYQEDSYRALRLRTDQISVLLDKPMSFEEPEEREWVRLCYADEELDYYPYYDECRIDQDLYSAVMLLIAEEPLRDVKLLGLEFVDVSENGRSRFRMETLNYFLGLMPRRPLLIELTITGDIPNRGVSFVDMDGVTHYYSISLSGYDGSPVLLEFEPY